ncbi:MAG: thioesterase family protein [Acetobacteraceae bacterium]|nr:thioesterase family protein [Acetobacteraceae bacterium]
MPAFQTTHRLRFNDTDRLGHVNNAVFAVMLEQGRSEMAFEAGLPLGGDTTSLVIVRLELDFVREMMWPGDVLVETEVLRLGGRSFTLQQRLLHGGDVCGRAQTVLVILDQATKRAISIDPWRTALQAFQP